MTRTHALHPVAISLSLLAFSHRAEAQGQPEQIRAAASTFATVEVHINSRPIGKRWYGEDAAFTGPARIAISYGQPHARGRKVEGGLIPMDTVWRFGANTATTLHTDLDLTLGTLRVPRGDYSLFILYSAKGWELIVNRGTAQWGTDRDASKDFGRVTLAARAMVEPEETLSVYLAPTTNPGNESADLTGSLKIKWGKTELSAGWKVDR